MYEYKATVTRVYDGDTITVNIDLGFHIQMQKQTIRLAGINAPEIRGNTRARGLESRDWLRRQILGEKVTLKTIKDRKGKYGRWIAEVYLPGQHRSINTQMAISGYAVLTEY